MPGKTKARGRCPAQVVHGSLPWKLAGWRPQFGSAAKKPGDKVRLTIFRFDKLRDMDITLGSDTRKDYSFESVENPSNTQKRLYREYMNNDL